MFQFLVWKQSALAIFPPITVHCGVNDKSSAFFPEDPAKINILRGVTSFAGNYYHFVQLDLICIS